MTIYYNTGINHCTVELCLVLYVCSLKKSFHPQIFLRMKTILGNCMMHGCAADTYDSLYRKAKMKVTATMKA